MGPVDFIKARRSMLSKNQQLFLVKKRIYKEAMYYNKCFAENQ